MRSLTRWNNNLALSYRSIGLLPPVRKTALADDQGTAHACLAVARQIARNFKFARFVENGCLACDPARVRLQAEAQGGNKNAVLGLSPAVVEDDRHGMPGRDQDACW